MADAPRRETWPPLPHLADGTCRPDAGRKTLKAERGEGSHAEFESGTPAPLNSPMTKTRIIYLGSPQNYDRSLARLLLEWLYVQTGYRGLVVVHEQGEA